MAMMTLNDCEFHYEVNDFTDPWVSSETIVLQHGFGRSGRFWYQWVPRLADEYVVIRRDMRGHGASADPGPDYVFEVDGLAADLIAFLDGLDVGPVHYVGESVAGMLGVLCAVRWPERFKSLTVCATPLAMLAKDAARAEDRLAVGGLDRTAALRDLGVGKWAESLMVPGKFAGLDGDEARRRWLIDEWDRTPRHVALNLMDAVLGLDVQPLLPGLRVPTLVLAPANSALQPLSRQVALRDAIPNAQIAVIDGPGHEIYFDRPAECTAALKRFLASIRAPTP